MNRVLVTGGAGFIGSHLCAALLDRGAEVFCVDSFLTGAPRNLAAIRSHPRFTFIEHDVVRPLPEVPPPDAIFHLASPASVADYLSLPIETLQVNSIGTMNMLDLAQRTGARLLYTSTSEAYGDPLVHPQPESYWGNVNPVGPRACYDEGKRFGEAAVMEWYRAHGTNTRVVRIFNTYGPHSRPDDGRIVPNFIMQALRNEPMTIYGDGGQTRSFCYVSDLVAGLMLAMEREGTAGQVFNLGNPDEYTVLRFAEEIATILGSSAGVIYRPLPTDDPVQRCPDITRARTVLGWQPAVPLADGIRATAEWFRELLLASPAG